VVFPKRERERGRGILITIIAVKPSMEQCRRCDLNRPFPRADTAIDGIAEIAHRRHRERTFRANSAENGMQGSRDAASADKHTAPPPLPG